MQSIVVASETLNLGFALFTNDQEFLTIKMWSFGRKAHS